MEPKLNKTKNAVNTLKRRSAHDENYIKGGDAMNIKSLKLSESQKCYEQKNNMRSNSTVLGNITNELPAARNFMAFRTNSRAKSDSGLDSSSSTSSSDSNVIRSPRSNKSDKKSFSIKNVDVCQIPTIKKNTVLLDNINELLEEDSQTSSNPSNSQQKACVYKNIKNTDKNSKSASHMLPGEILALYEFEVDENEPKHVKKKRKRKRPIKEPDTSDSDLSPFMSVVKQMQHLIIGNRARITMDTSSSGLQDCKPDVDQVLQVFKQLPSVENVASKVPQKNMTLKTPNCVNMCLPISPIERSGGKSIHYSPKTVCFANSPSATSTPLTHALIHKTGETSELQNEASPALKMNTQRHGGVSSIYIRPNSNVHHKFVLDDSICLGNEESTQWSPKTPPNVQDFQPVLRHKIVRTTSMQHFFRPENGANCSNNDSSPKHEPPKELSMTFDDRVTVHKKFKFVPRVSRFKPRVSMPECGELALENYFGFDADIKDETTAPLIAVATTSKFNSKIPESSTPYHSNVLSTKPQPASFGVGDLKKMLDPLIAKTPEYFGTHPHATNQLLTSTSAQSSPARHSYSGPTHGKRVRDNEDLQDGHGTPEKKPKKEKQEVKVKGTDLRGEEDLWYANVNSHFNDIEGMELSDE